MPKKSSNPYPDFTPWKLGTVLLNRPNERVPIGSAVTKIFHGLERAELVKVVCTVDTFCPDYPSIEAHNAVCIADNALYEIIKGQRLPYEHKN